MQRLNAALAALLIISPCLAQTRNRVPDPVVVSGAPTGACTTGFRVDSATSTLYACVENAWVSVGGGGGGGAKTLYYAPAAKTIAGQGYAVYQCSANCGVATAKVSGTAITATLHVTGALIAVWDQFVIPTGYSDNEITVEVLARTATDNNAAHAATVTVTSGVTAANGDPLNPTLGNSTALTFNPSTSAGGLVRMTGTFTPSSWTAGKLAAWKAAFDQGTVTSDVEIVSVRFYATF